MQCTISHNVHLVWITVTVGATVGYESSLDQRVLHFLQFISPTTGILVEHVARSLVGGQLESVTVSEGTLTRRECSVIANLDFFNTSVQDADVVTRPAEFPVHVLELRHQTVRLSLVVGARWRHADGVRRYSGCCKFQE